MIEVEVSSIRVSLMNQQRIVVLKDLHEDRFLPIWIGQFEAEAITIELQETEQPRPLTHDLLKDVIEAMDGKIKHILINDLRRDVFYAKIVVQAGEREIEIDSRPSDAIALSVRAKAPIFVSETVMEKASYEPEEDVDLDSEEPGALQQRNVYKTTAAPEDKGSVEAIDESKFSAFADFVNSLDLDLDESASDDEDS